MPHGAGAVRGRHGVERLLPRDHRRLAVVHAATEVHARGASWGGAPRSVLLLIFLRREPYNKHLEGPSKETIMKCDICGQDIENSEELSKHKEEMHPPEKGDNPTANLEKPDLDD